MIVQIKRIYDDLDQNDGLRLLVDRLWPRGLSKDKAHLDGWAKELAPSPRLRTWFDHQAQRFPEFSALYREELDARTQAKKPSGGYSGTGKRKSPCGMVSRPPR